MKKYLLLFIFIASCQFAGAQRLQNVVKDLPEDNIFGISASTVQYLIENPTDSLRKTSTYVSDEIVRESISDDYFRIRTSKVGYTEVKLLPLVNDSRIICVSKTVCSTVCDSQIYFFTEKWKPIDKGELLPLAKAEWFIKPNNNFSESDREYVISLLNKTLPMKYQLDTEDQTLTLSVDPSTFLDSQTYTEFKDIFSETPKVLNWSKVRFEE